MKAIAALMSFGALTYSVVIDLNLNRYSSLIPAVALGFDLETSP